MQLVGGLDDNPSVAQRQHAFFFQTGIFLLFVPKHREARLLVPMLRNFSEPRQTGLLVFRVFHSVLRLPTFACYGAASCAFLRQINVAALCLCVVEVTACEERTGLLRDNAVRPDGEGYNNVVINHEQNAMAVGDVEVENLVAVPCDAFEFMAMEGGMPPVAAEQGEFGASGFLYLRRQVFELAFETAVAAEDHRSLTMPSIDSYSCGSTASSSRSLQSSMSFAVGVRDGTLAANNTASAYETNSTTWPDSPAISVGMTEIIRICKTRAAAM